MDTQAPVWKLYLFGAPLLEHTGKIIEMDTRKALALLAYLALSGSQSRESLAVLFWPEYDQASARGALRRTLSTLQKATQGELIDANRERVEVRKDAPLWIDVQVFHQLLQDLTLTSQPEKQKEILQQAIDLYTGDFLQGFTLRDSPAFDDWQYFQTDSLRREYASALENLAMAYSLQKEDENAILAVRRWLALDELQEDAHRFLMKLYAWTGQRGAALRQYRECVRILEQELGVPPLPETTQLYQAILENQLPTRPVVEMPISPQHPTFQIQPEGYPLTGRETELGQLLNIYWTGAGQGALVIIEGEAGIGKTRLAEEILEIARRAGAMTLTAHCYEGEAQLAYGPFVESISSILSQPSSQANLLKVPAHWLCEANRLAPALNELYPNLLPPIPIDGPAAQSRFFEGVRQLLLGLLAGAKSGKPPGILFLDDLQWADSATLDLFIYLVRRLRGQALLVLATCRNWKGVGETRLAGLIAGTVRAGYGYILQLDRLTPQAVFQLARCSPLSLTQDVCEQLYRETEGLPLMVTAYLDALPQLGLPLGESKWDLPSSVRSVLHSRLPAPDEPSWQLLTTAAVIGHSFDFDTLRQASGRSEAETISGLETLLAMGLIQEQSEHDQPAEVRYGFTHEKILRLVYDEISLSRRRLLHQRIADVLSMIYPRRDSGHLAARIAQHYRSAGQDPLATEYFQKAGDYARQLYANQEALTHYRSALALSPDQPAPLHEAIGDLQALSGDYPAAIQSYETAAALLNESDLSKLEQKLGNIHSLLGAWELAECHYQAALEGIQDPARQAWTYADWSRSTFRRGESERALQLAEKSLELAHLSQEDRALVQAYNILGILERNRGHLDISTQHLEHSFQLAKKLGDLYAQAAALNNLALIQASRIDFNTAIQLASQALSICLQLGDRHKAAALHNNLADFYHAQGDQDSAMQHLKQAVMMFSEIGVEEQDSKPEIWKLTEW